MTQSPPARPAPAARRRPGVLARTWAGVRRAGAILTGLLLFLVVQVGYRWLSWRERRAARRKGAGAPPPR